MAGTSDKPFRMICREQGAGLTTSEMVVIQSHLMNSNKSKYRLDFTSEKSPISIQIAGSGADELAYSAKKALEFGADIVDINMGCPAKKVCNKLAGSALMKDLKKVEDILRAVISSVEVPVTLKMRTGWDLENRNAREIALLAEYLGIKSIAIHGRTRACRFQGDVEYETISKVVEAVSIPVFANGDINSAEKANSILKNTNASGVMIGRAAQGKPWIFNEINNLVIGNPKKSCIYNLEVHGIEAIEAQQELILTHLNYINDYYKNFNESSEFKSKIRRNTGQPLDLAVRIARKHICPYFIQMVEWGKYRSLLDATLVQSDSEQALKKYIKTIEIAKKHFNRLLSYNDQTIFLKKLFSYTNKTGDIAA